MEREKRLIVQNAWGWDLDEMGIAAMDGQTLDGPQASTHLQYVPVIWLVYSVRSTLSRVQRISISRAIALQLYTHQPTEASPGVCRAGRRR